MALSPAEPLQKAVYKALSEHEGVKAAFGTAPPRIYDEVPTAPAFPYIYIGDDQIIADNSCEAEFECFVNVHVYSRKPGRGKMEAKEIGARVTDALGGELTVAGFRHIHDDNDPPLDGERYFYEPDQKTAHGVLTFKILIGQA